MKKKELLEMFNQNQPDTPMIADEATFMMNLLLIQDKDTRFSTDVDEIDLKSGDLNHFEPIIYSLLFKRFQKEIKSLGGIKMSLAASLVIMQHISNLKSLKVYSLYLYSKLPDNTFVDLKNICEELFPWGFFSDEQIFEIYNSIESHSLKIAV